jgi:predicted anti-sigma-YlaC factor YlaD
MRCKHVQSKLSDGLGRNSISYPDSLKEHLESCSECSEFLRELTRLRSALIKPDLAVAPGELDDITFENIIMAPDSIKVENKGRSRAWRLGWVLAPLALVAVIAAVISFTTFSPQPAGVYVANNVGIATEQDLIGQIAANDTLPDEVISSLATGDQDLDYAVEEIISQGEIDQILNSLSDEELQALYSKIDQLKG